MTETDLQKQIDDLKLALDKYNARIDILENKVSTYHRENIEYAQSLKRMSNAFDELKQRNNILDNRQLVVEKLVAEQSTQTTVVASSKSKHEINHKIIEVKPTANKLSADIFMEARIYIASKHGRTTTGYDNVSNLLDLFADIHKKIITLEQFYLICVNKGLLEIYINKSLNTATKYSYKVTKKGVEFFGSSASNTTGGVQRTLSGKTYEMYCTVYDSVFAGA